MLGHCLCRFPLFKHLRILLTTLVEHVGRGDVAGGNERDQNFSKVGWVGSGIQGGGYETEDGRANGLTHICVQLP